MEEKLGPFDAAGNIAPDKVISVLIQQIAEMRALIDYIAETLEYQMKVAHPEADFERMDQIVARIATRYMRQMTQDLGLTITETQGSNPPSSE